jgi:hypothetical protein
MEYATHDGFCGFGPQNPSKGSEEEHMTHGSIEELASRLSYLMKGTVPLDENYVGLD